MYFINEVLSNSKAHYPRVQKLLYAVLITKCKLWHYFDAHPMVVMSSSGLWDVINNQESTSRIAKWGLNLMGLDITYTPYIMIRSHVLADFMVEWTMEQASTAPIKAEYRTMYFNCSLTLNGPGTRVLLIYPSGDKLRYAL